MGRHLMRSRYPVSQSCNNLKSESMESFEIPFTQSNNLENINMDSISLTPSVPQKENFDTHNVEFFEKDMQYSDDLWIETTAPNGRVYFYNASSRVSRWDKPENVKIMTLDHIRLLANAPHINPIQNTNMESIYAPLNQQPHLRFLPPPQAATGAPSSMFMFPPPNLNTPPPFQARTTPILKMLDVSSMFIFLHQSKHSPPFQARTTPIPKSWIVPYLSHEAVAMNQPYFDDTLQNIQISNETDNISEEREVTAVEFHENDSDDIKIHQSQEEQVSLNEANESVPEEMDESNIRNSPVKDSLPSLTDETQNLSSSAVGDQNSGKDDVSETIIKPIDKSRPVSSTPVPGSKWCVVWTGNDKVFFYDADRKISVWEMPNELKNRTDVQKLVESPPSAMEKKQSTSFLCQRKLKLRKKIKQH
ncbi:Transcription elongation regulator 1-like [Argiope bruennichi]|uniref:Transcription elongation regulator 1-like n=1 Tax=Argiope bruennichi TaxID=94029 RepID=A0A8T0E255_ARGBR|nr:Transcription elongation regulator 1-like [Argiope bruennichi]